VVTRIGVSNAGVSNMAESTLCATHGSSGGPVYKNHTGYGLISSEGDSDCDIYYQGLLGAASGSHVGLLQLKSGRRSDALA
jgi:hypothetical protein